MLFTVLASLYEMIEACKNFAAPPACVHLLECNMLNVTFPPLLLSFLFSCPFFFPENVQVIRVIESERLIQGHNVSCTFPVFAAAPHNKGCVDLLLCAGF
jgi:hypothetical protein